MLKRSWYRTHWLHRYREAVSSLGPRSSSVDILGLRSRYAGFECCTWWGKRMAKTLNCHQFPLEAQTETVALTSASYLTLHHSSYSLPRSHILVKGRWMPDSEEQFLVPHSEEICIGNQVIKDLVIPTLLILLSSKWILRSLWHSQLRRVEQFPFYCEDFGSTFPTPGCCHLTQRWPGLTYLWEFQTLNFPYSFWHWALFMSDFWWTWNVSDSARTCVPKASLVFLHSFIGFPAQFHWFSSTVPSFTLDSSSAHVLSLHSTNHAPRPHGFGVAGISE